MLVTDERTFAGTGMPRKYPFDDLEVGGDFTVDDVSKFGVVRTIASMRGVGGKKFTCQKLGGVLMVRRVS